MERKLNFDKMVYGDFCQRSHHNVGWRTQAHFLLHRCGQRKERPQEHHVLPISRRCKGDGLLDVGL